MGSREEAAEATGGAGGEARSEWFAGRSTCLGTGPTLSPADRVSHFTMRHACHAVFMGFVRGRAGVAQLARQRPPGH